MKENFKYMIKNWLDWDKKSLLFFIIRVPATVFQPIVMAYIPKAMIDCITEGVSIGKMVTTVALLSLLLVVTVWLDPFMRELINGSARVIRMRYAMMAFDKNLNADFMHIESLSGREKNSRASEFYKSYYSGSADFFDTLNFACVSAVGVITSVALIYKINIGVIILIFASCIVEFFLLKYLNTKKLGTHDERHKIYAKLNYFYEQSKNLSASKDIKIYGFADRFIAVTAQFIYDFEKLVATYSKQAIAVSGTRALLNMLREVIAYAYLVYLVTKGSLSVADFVFYFGIITGFSNWICNFVYCYSGLEYCCKECQRFREFVETDDNFESNGKDEFSAEEIDSIEFKNVTFAYPETDKDTIKNMSFKVNKGENIAIVGENGAGKTTVVKLLCGLYYATSGDILINGKKASDIDKKSYCNLFAPVFQDYSFLPMTIAENVAVTKSYDKERLYDAFEKAGIAEKIQSLDKKENTFMVKDVYKDAVDFSGGEKQKLLLAKAVYKNAPVLILDEPTAALDPIAENELYLKYNDMTDKKISFFISHRLSSTRFCNRIFFISDGQIAECGTHEELMAKKGKYYKMYQIQSYYYKEQGVRYE
ncbi:MAG: ABC transporter ATP-binding protein/permease [Faecalibacterium sp.]|nr:ABC transporter ATP-binding protein/permease [Ruminococcus sp.]MCM1391795.1 ABC transporter ATP-binding protein/permease [Ruminococcus sp.]MCM1485441.1 ABC transporter ATP-binding protein/permease [Faecalibacterium sp.]